MLTSASSKLMKGFRPLLEFALSRPSVGSQLLSLTHWRNLLKQWGFPTQSGTTLQPADAVAVEQTITWLKVGLNGACSSICARAMGQCLQFVMADEVQIAYALNIYAKSFEQPCPDELAHHHIAALVLTRNLQFALLLAEVRSINCGDDAAALEGIALLKLMDELPFSPLSECLNWRLTPFELRDLAAGCISLDVDETLNPFSLLIRF